MERNTNTELQYQQALKQVKKIKGFYIHLFVYLIINLIFVIINFQNLDQGESYFQWKNFATAICWGIGLLAHALSTFLPLWIFGLNWEDRKIKEFMERDKNKQWQ
jgi:uncharacterized integral membrane protein